MGPASCVFELSGGKRHCACRTPSRRMVAMWLVALAFCGTASGAEPEGRASLGPFDAQVEQHVTQLQDPSPEVRAWAAEALGFQRAYRAESALSEQLRDTVPSVRRNAAMALAWCGGRAAVAPLIELLGDEDWSVRQSAWVALTNLTGMEFPFNAVAMSAETQDCRQTPGGNGGTKCRRTCRRTKFSRCSDRAARAASPTGRRSRCPAATRVSPVIWSTARRTAADSGKRKTPRSRSGASWTWAGPRDRSSRGLPVRSGILHVGLRSGRELGGRKVRSVDPCQGDNAGCVGDSFPGPPGALRQDHQLWHRTAGLPDDVLRSRDLRARRRGGASTFVVTAGRAGVVDRAGRASARGLGRIRRGGGFVDSAGARAFGRAAGPRRRAPRFGRWADCGTRRVFRNYWPSSIGRCGRGMRLMPWAITATAVPCRTC